MAVYVGIPKRSAKKSSSKSSVPINPNRHVYYIDAFMHNEQQSNILNYITDITSSYEGVALADICRDVGINLSDGEEFPCDWSFDKYGFIQLEYAECIDADSADLMHPCIMGCVVEVDDNNWLPVRKELCEAYSKSLTANESWNNSMAREAVLKCADAMLREVVFPKYYTNTSEWDFAVMGAACNLIDKYETTNHASVYKNVMDMLSNGAFSDFSELCSEIEIADKYYSRKCQKSGLDKSSTCARLLNASNSVFVQNDVQLEKQ